MSKHTTPNQAPDLTPLAVCELLFGRPEKIGPLCELDPKAVYVWRRKTKWRDAGDIPSARYMRRLLAFARANHIPLEPRHLIEGATRAEIDALLAARASFEGMAA